MKRKSEMREVKGNNNIFISWSGGRSKEIKKTIDFIIEANIIRKSS